MLTTRLIVGAALLALAGCAQMQALNDSIDSMSDSRKVGTDTHGNAISANDLQQQFRDITGYSLAKPEGELKACSDMAYCRFDAWKRAYDHELSAYQLNIDRVRRQQEEAKKHEAEQACLAKPSCRREMDKTEVKRRLQQSYETMVTMLSRSPAEGDSIFREFCGQAATAQRQGVSRAELAGRVEDLPGISPYYRQFFVESAEACWDSAKFGMSWKEAIRIPRRR